MEGYYKRIIRVLHVKVRNAPILIVAPHRHNQPAQNMRARDILRKKPIPGIARVEHAPMKSAVHKIPNPRVRPIISYVVVIMKMDLRSIQPPAVVTHVHKKNVANSSPNVLLIFHVPKIPM